MKKELSNSFFDNSFLPQHGFGTFGACRSAKALIIINFKFISRSFYFNLIFKYFILFIRKIIKYGIDK